MAKSKKQQIDLFTTVTNLEALKIKKTQSKIYQKINAKIRKLHKEKKALELLKSKILDVNKEYNERIEPIQNKIFEEDEKTLLLFDKFRNKKSVGKRYKEMALDQMRSIINHFANAGYMSSAISEIEQEIRQYDFNFTKEEEVGARETFEAMMAEMFDETGVKPDVSFEDFKSMSMEDIMEKVQQQMFEKHTENQKQENQEYKQEQQSYNDDTFKKMYKTLAKILHPDKQNANTIDNKEQLMKDLALAWEERNYLKLLEINVLVNPDAEEIKLDKNHLKEIERHISEELFDILQFKDAVKNDATEEFYRYNQFYNVLKSKREAKFKDFETLIKGGVLDKKEFNKTNFKSIKNTRQYLDETGFDLGFDEDILNMFEDIFEDDLFEDDLFEDDLF